MGELRKFDQLYEPAIAGLTEARHDNVVEEEATDDYPDPANFETPFLAAASLPNNVSAKAKKDVVDKAEIKHNKKDIRPCTTMKKKKLGSNTKDVRKKKKESHHRKLTKNN